ncbi:penicillin-binding transpeptidase domain-containing protein [Crocinitomicaceae bacterium]|nr:penicillin-binding transpeptidase domain-containing protein [Crocinitomicaceae bacterium]
MLIFSSVQARFNSVQMLTSSAKQDIMRLLIPGVLLLLMIGCAEGSKLPNTYTRSKEPVKFQSIDLNDLFGAKNLGGQILIYDESSNQYTSSDFGVAKDEFSPASTFKIPNTIIGLETGTITEDFIFKYDGAPRRLESWKKDLVLRDAFQSSCVPCYQELARNIGLTQMKSYMDSLAYTGMVIRKDNLDEFWLTGESKISPLQQVDFLRRLITKQFNLKESTRESMKNIMARDTSTYGIRYAKTGWGEHDGKDMGWFVGYIQKPKNRIYFATLIIREEGFPEALFGDERIRLTDEVLRILKFW